MNARRDLYAALMAGGPHSPERSEKASALIDAFAAEARAVHRAELPNRVSKGVEVPEVAEDSVAAIAAREIQALHDPTVIGYTVGVERLTLTLRPSTEAQWSAWQERLSCPVGSTTYRGGHATSHGQWGDVLVHVVCVLDRMAGGAS